MLRTIVLLLVAVLILGTGLFERTARTMEVFPNVKGNSGGEIVGVNTLVLSPKKFHRSLRRWIEYRIKQGHEIGLLTPAASALGIKRQIREVARTNPLKHVVIVGDSGDANSGAHDLVQTDYIAAKVNVKFGSEPEIATDNTYADLNGDGIPDLTIGRMPVDAPAELELLTSRIIKYESETEDASWRRRVNLVAGVGGFGQVIDGLIEQTTKQIVTDLVPAGYETKMTYGSWRSPYCPDPRRFSDEAIARFNEGCMFWVYIGHGNRHRLDKIYMPDQSHRILDGATVSKLNCRSGNPIAIFLACYTGATDHAEDCLAEQMLKQKNGPIAAICGTRVTMPYAMSLLSLEMVHEFFNGDVETLGELMLVAKKRMVEGSGNNREYREMIEGMGKTFSPVAGMLKQERLEHVDLIHLIGDPLLRLKRPAKIDVKSAEVAFSGETLSVAGAVPSAGELTVELSYRRDRFRQRPSRRKEYDSSDQSFKLYQETYEQTQKLVCSAKKISVAGGEFKLDLPVPADAIGKCVVRAMLVSDGGFGLGSVPVEIKKAPNTRSAEKIDVQIK
ncbi:MAG: C25 family cysteine peptidase [Mariniblastus sp.]